MSKRALALCGAVLLVAVARLVPHPPNFTPVGALALFGAAHFPSRWAGFLVPLAALFLSDCFLGFYAGMWAVYGTIGLIACIGLLLRRRTTARSVAGAVLASAVLFFVVTNFAVWAIGTLYPMSWEGLLACYVAAIPFFHWTLLGDLCYGTVLFGGFAIAERRLPVLLGRSEPLPAQA